MGESTDIQESALIELFERYRRQFAAGESHTARAKRLDLDRFERFLIAYRRVKRADALKVRDWDHSSVQRFIDDLLRKGEAPATVSRRLATIKHMGRTLAEEVAGFVNPARLARGPSIQAAAPKSVEAGEVENVRARAEARAAEKPGFGRERNKVLFELLIDTGLRADEIRLLKLGQLDERHEWIQGVKTKGRKYRNVYVSEGMRERLRNYLAARSLVLKKFFAKLTAAQDANLPLFVSTYNVDPAKPDSFLMGSKTVWRAIRELSVDTRLHPHLLRHTYAHELLESSADIRLVAQALGHSDVRVTMRYTERRDAEIASAVERARADAEPSAKKPRGAPSVTRRAAEEEEEEASDRKRT